MSRARTFSKLINKANYRIYRGDAAVSEIESATETTVVDGPVVINESGADVDFRVESDTDENALFVDGETGNVGIGTSSPSGKLDVVGDIKTSGEYVINSGTTPKWTLGQSSDSLYFYSVAAGTERMRIDSSGNVGVGTSSPSHRLHVSGSANIGGITMTSFGAGDTGISVNQGGGGGVALLLATRNTDAGTSTDAAVYLIQFYYSGDNLPNLIYLGGDSNWVTISKSASNTLVIDDKSGNDSYAIFGLSI